MLLLTGTLVKGQNLIFSHLSTSDGLSDNNARSLAIDNNGFLWIGTSDGLNVYNGYTVTSYKREQWPALASDMILHLVCDSRNRVWLGTYTGASWVDETRTIHRITIQDTLTEFYCPGIFETATYGVVLYTDKGHYYFDSTAGKWKNLDWIPEQFNKKTFLDAEPLTGDKIIITLSDRVSIVDYATRQVIYEKKFELPVSACPAGEQEIAIGLQPGRIIVENYETGKMVRDYQLDNTLNGKTLGTYLSEVRRAANGDLLVATDFAGLIIINSDGVITRNTHDPIHPGTISANNTYRAFAGKRGEVVVGTYTSGANMTNIFNKPAGYVKIFKDKNANLFDNYLTDFAEEGNDVFWIGAYDRLIRWDRKNNLSSFYYYFQQSENRTRSREIHAVCVDRTGKIWVGVAADGIALFDKATGTFKNIPRDTSLGRAISSNYVYDIVNISDGKLWVGSNGGVYSVNPVTRAIISYENHPQLKELEGRRVYNIYEARDKSLWFATSNGVYNYNEAAGTIKHYTMEDGLVSNTAFAVAEDKKGNIYVAMSAGFSLLDPDGYIHNYTRLEGLRYARCESMQEDDEGNIWIANNKCLLKFNPGDHSMEFFEDNAGLSIDGFRVGAFLKAKSGELLWGSESGLNYFFPGKLVSTPSRLQVSLYAIDIKDTVFNFSNNRKFSFPYSQNDVTFHFTAINMNGSRGIIYQYKLEGYDKEWHTGVDLREAHYSSLPAGDYTFSIRASIDRETWVTSNNAAVLHIVPPVWRRWWAVAGSLLLVVLFISWYVRDRNKKIRQHKEQVETEQAINYFASSMYEQQKVENILWDVARNCIGRLHFEDCVIYLLDEERNMLVQKAAHGPKSNMNFEISEPLEIPAGKGIVGSVAATGRAEIIGDTAKDERYIVDDKPRLSEITVPIISDGEVLGVIDCEHSERNFFTPKHLSILTTIASLCANKIVRARAEEEKEQTRLTLMETQQKMAEVEMQALRAQMNPHFIFNCLNSINRYIVKSDQATASLYLTRFAKLIRLILDNSNNKNVILSNELEALKLYIDMEALRFDRKFSYEIIVDEDVPADSIEVPPLIIQPYVENAIWHGLLHLQMVGHLKIHISMPVENMLQCVIEDNGVGREKAKELKSKSVTTKKSLGMKLTENRLSLLNKHAELNASIEIIDLIKEDKEAAGTKVILKIPI